MHTQGQANSKMKRLRIRNLLVVRQPLNPIKLVLPKINLSLFILMEKPEQFFLEHMLISISILHITIILLHWVIFHLLEDNLIFKGVS